MWCWWKCVRDDLTLAQEKKGIASLDWMVRAGVGAPRSCTNRTATEDRRE